MQKPLLQCSYLYNLSAKTVQLNSKSVPFPFVSFCFSNIDLIICPFSILLWNPFLGFLGFNSKEHESLFLMAYQATAETYISPSLFFFSPQILNPRILKLIWVYFQLFLSKTKSTNNGLPLYGNTWGSRWNSLKFSVIQLLLIRNFLLNTDNIFCSLK